MRDPSPSSRGNGVVHTNPSQAHPLNSGGGVKGGSVYGVTDEFGFAAQHNKVHVHDLDATIQNLMDLDHEMLSYGVYRARFETSQTYMDVWLRR